MGIINKGTTRSTHGRIKKKTSFTQQLERIKCITGARTQGELAKVLGIHQSAITETRRHGKIPSNWLALLLKIKGIHPEWILTGNGACCIHTPVSKQHTINNSGAMAQERKNDEETLQRVSTQKIADELVRRAWLLCKQVSAFPKKE